MQAGCPVLASDDPALVEAAGGAALHLPPDDPSGWTKAMLRALDDREWAAQLQQRGERRAAELTWARSAEKTRAIYEQAIRRR